MEELVKKGKARNIGVSKLVVFSSLLCRRHSNYVHLVNIFSFNVRRLQNLTANPLEIRPAINQVELNYWNPQPDLVKVRRRLRLPLVKYSSTLHIQWSQENGILLEAYSPLGSAKKVKETLQIPEVCFR
jgi:diketogulonate reductase-like aldo/keto reductase